ncbi:MAG: hypothetical protein AB8B85_21015 [Paracoccaceae bacterium]
MKQILLERFESPSATALHKPQPEREAEAEREAADAARTAEAAAEAEARAKRETALAEVLGTLADAVGRSRMGAIQAVCSDLGDVAAAALPSLLGDGFAKEVAAASVNIVDAAGISGASLRASPLDAETIVSVLKTLGPGQAFTVTADTKLKDGEVRLDWGAGGATFDSDAWAANIRALCATQIDARINEGMEHDTRNR